MILPLLRQPPFIAIHIILRDQRHWNSDEGRVQFLAPDNLLTDLDSGLCHRKWGLCRSRREDSFGLQGGDGIRGAIDGGNEEASALGLLACQHHTYSFLVINSEDSIQVWVGR